MLYYCNKYSVLAFRSHRVVKMLSFDSFRYRENTLSPFTFGTVLKGRFSILNPVSCLEIKQERDPHSKI